jgi:uncharacterized protein
MTKNEKLAAVIEKYKQHPQFLRTEIRDPNQRGPLDDTLLHLAARRGAVDDIEVLVAAGANINAAGDLGYTPLHRAAMVGKLDAVKKLVDLGADPRIENELGETPSKVAELGGHEEIVALLQRYRPKPRKTGEK